MCARVRLDQGSLQDFGGKVLAHLMESAAPILYSLPLPHESAQSTQGAGGADATWRGQVWKMRRAEQAAASEVLRRRFRAPRGEAGGDGSRKMLLDGLVGQTLRFVSGREEKTDAPIVLVQVCDKPRMSGMPSASWLTHTHSPADDMRIVLIRAPCGDAGASWRWDVESAGAVRP